MKGEIKTGGDMVSGAAGGEFRFGARSDVVRTLVHVAVVWWLEDAERKYGTGWNRSLPGSGRFWRKALSPVLAPPNRARESNPWHCRTLRAMPRGGERGDVVLAYAPARKFIFMAGFSRLNQRGVIGTQLRA